MSLPPETQVLIVGAGPTGMACALTLTGLGVQVTLVDAFPDNRNGSRSVAIHARTLEVLNTVGLAESLLKAGIQSRGGIVHGGANKLIQIDIGQLSDVTEFPITLLIPQHEVERILRAKLADLGVQILRPHSVVGMKEISPDGGLEVTFDNGATIRSHYVVGADGSRSTIRHLANIDFKDPATGIDYDGTIPPPLTMQIVLADVYFQDPLPSSIPRDMISFHLDKFFLMCPLRSEEGTDKNLSFWRIGIGAPPGAPPLPRNPDITWVREQMDKRGPWNSKLHVASVETSSRYRIRSAVASTFFKKFGSAKVLLVGDAAHVHSPAGAQGLNLGLCDAVDLGRAIRASIDANSNDDAETDAPLSLYSVSRRKIALRVVEMAGGLTRLAAAGTGWRRIVRNIMLWIIGRTPFVGRIIAWRISGLMNRDA